jgi:hypothetical protein
MNIPEREEPSSGMMIKNGETGIISVIYETENCLKWMEKKEI